MKAVILAAGRGSRLGHYTTDIPKTLNKVAQKSIIEYIISSLKSAGINHVIIISGYQSHLLNQYADTMIINEEWASTNMVASLLCAKQFFSENLIISYSDVIYSSETVMSLKNQKKDIVVPYYLGWKKLWEMRFSDPLSDLESFCINQEGSILDIGQKVNAFNDIQGQFMGILRFTPRAFGWIEQYLSSKKKDIAQMDMTTLLRGLIAKGHSLHGMPVNDLWMEIDNPKDLQLANKYFLTLNSSE